MEQSAKELNFELAARLRDQIQAIEKSMEKQNVVSSRMEDIDAIGCLQSGHRFFIVVLTIRDGKLISTKSFKLSHRWSNKSEVIGEFIKQYYIHQSFIPDTIITSEEPEDRSSIEIWLSDTKGKKVKISRPKRGKKAEIINLALKNAMDISRKEDISTHKDLLDSLKKTLGLKKMPSKIEGVDISVMGGEYGVGALVCFKDGMPMKAGYRNYRIKTVQGIDDYSMIKEVIGRRLSRGDLPDLMVVDGGRAHLESVLDVINNTDVKDPPEVISIAKADKDLLEKVDKIYTTGRKDPIILEGNDPVLLFLMRIRDEAHRRAISYSRKLKIKDMRVSALDKIKGVGEKRKRELLKRFGSIEGILNATPDEISSITGISSELAKKIKSELRESV